MQAWLQNETPGLALFKLEPISGSPEKVNKLLNCKEKK
jgi:hypothetical protein